MIYYLIMSASLAAVDSALKKVVEKELPLEEKGFNIGKYIRIEKIHNYGAMTGRLSEYPKLVMLLHTVGIGCSLKLFYHMVICQSSQIKKLGAILVLGGGLSNYADRLSKGYVTDYINFPKSAKGFKRLVFNLSDFCIGAGAILMIL